MRVSDLFKGLGGQRPPGMGEPGSLETQAHGLSLFGSVTLGKTLKSVSSLQWTGAVFLMRAHVREKKKTPTHVCTEEGRGLSPAVPPSGCRGRSLPRNAQISLRLLTAALDLVIWKAIKLDVDTLPGATLSYMEELRC